MGKGKKLKYCLIVLKLFLVLVKTSQKIFIFFFLGVGSDYCVVAAVFSPTFPQKVMIA